VKRASRRHRRPAPRPARGRGTPRRPPGRRRGPTVTEYSRIDIDLVREAYQRSNPNLVSRLESLFGEREVVEVEGLLGIVASVLRALASQGFSRVDHWEARPGGWLPLPEPAHERLEEPVGHLLHALRSDAWKKVGGARSFAARLSGARAIRADVTVRRVHRERAHAVTVELFGPTSSRDLQGIERSLRGELTVARLRRNSA